MSVRWVNWPGLYYIAVDHNVCAAVYICDKKSQCEDSISLREKVDFQMQRCVSYSSDILSHHSFSTVDS